MRYIRYDELKRRGIVSNRSTLSRWIRQGLFPRPVRLGPGTVAWPETAVSEWEASRPVVREAV